VARVGARAAQGWWRLVVAQEMVGDVGGTGKLTLSTKMLGTQA
jgi:hypothetical protein